MFFIEKPDKTVFNEKSNQIDFNVKPDELAEKATTLRIG